jgi:hypothetical protein
VVRNSGRRKEFEEFKELQEFKNGSQESGGPGPRRILVTEKSFFKKKPVALGVFLTPRLLDSGS